MTLDRTRKQLGLFFLSATIIAVGPVKAADLGPRGVQATTLTIDETWAGIPVNISAVSVGPIVYVAYYDAVRQLSVASIDTVRGTTSKRKLDSIFEGWDAHNYISLTYDHSGFLHLSGNMHDAPLVYARMFQPNKFESFNRVGKMVGRDEATVTYPRFFFFPNGDLGFSYRSGKSGDGVEIINRFDGSSWSRHLDTPVFGSDPSGPKVNAYHTGYIMGPDGYFHTAWVWRLSRMVETNFNVNYARSKDLKTWFDSEGRPLSLPLSPGNADIVDKIPPGRGLFNNIKLGFNGLDEPVVSYLKYDEAGNTQLYHALPKETGWKISKVTDWNYRWEFKGGGAIVPEISFSGVKMGKGQVTESVRHRDTGSVTISYDTDGMIKTKIAAPLSSPSQDCPNRKPWRQMETAINPTSANSYRGKVIWRTLPPGNADQPRSCERVGLGHGCSMVSKLLVAPEAVLRTQKSRLISCDS